MKKTGFFRIVVISLFTIALIVPAAMPANAQSSSSATVSAGKKTTALNNRETTRAITSRNVKSAKKEPPSLQHSKQTENAIGEKASGAPSADPNKSRRLPRNYDDSNTNITSKSK
jgi:hypothetical protein